VTDSFVPDYLVLVFLASCGVFQMAAALNGLRGLMFFKRRGTAFVFGLVLWVGAFAWFFLSEPRNLPDTGLGLDGNQQFGYFFAGAGVGLAVTLLVSSVKNRNLGQGRSGIPLGIDALAESNYLRALYRTLRPWLPRLLRRLKNTGYRCPVGIPESQDVDWPRGLQ
jgi:hypothetical protein